MSETKANPNPNPEYVGLLRRGAAYLIDCVIVFFVFAATQVLVFTPLRSLMGITNEWFRSGINTQLYTIATISIPVWLYFSIFESSKRRSTIGKRILNIEVVDQFSLNKISFQRAFGRTIIKLLPWETAHLANNLPEPVWYATDPGFRIGFALVGVLMGVYILVIALNGKRQGLHDMLVGSAVIAKPR